MNTRYLPERKPCRGDRIVFAVALVELILLLMGKL